ncbi:M1 family metallopeptidase [Actinokineospora enzanensis]|uniref:M1 family metallopeptidase n=1 Tax=Actinokineospora enzanensis TaxID=155975 RepID=UPI00037221AC|nr:M1 family metallopeptidase [Actinokineospora enzanensis]
MRRARLACVLLTATALAACTNTAEPPRPSATTGTRAPAGPSAAGIGDPYYPDDGNGGYDVTAYEVKIGYDPPSKHLEGDTTVTATATDELARFNLDLTGLTVSAVDIDGKQARFSREGEHELVINPDTPIAKGATFRTRVRYAGEPQLNKDGTLGPNGWQIAKSGGAFAAGEPHSASTWYPVNDHPLDKATFRLSAQVPDDWSVISNGHEEAPRSANGLTTYTWVEPNRVATYLTTIGIDKWTFERSTLADGTPVVSAYAPGAEDKKPIEAHLPEVLAFLSDKFGPYPQSAAGGIFVNESISFSLETQTRPTYAKWANLDVIVHEQAHQWFGDSVSLERWSDICLNECFASYAQWLWAEAKNGTDLDARYRAVVDKSKDAFWNRKLVDMGPGNEFTAVYDKGQLALHALRRQIGDDKFATLLKQWISTHRDGNATWPEFEAMAAQVAGQDLTRFLDAWFHQASKPADEFLYPGSLRK